MKKRTKLAASAGAALAVVGAGGALAADRLTPSDESKAVVDDAAEIYNVVFVVVLFSVSVQGTLLPVVAARLGVRLLPRAPT